MNICIKQGYVIGNIQMNEQNVGWLNGLFGVVIFAGSLPATRIAVMGFSPEFITGARASIASILALFILWFFQAKPFKQNLPQRTDWIPLLIVAFGVVFGFPFFTALALEHISSARALVFVALLPLTTAIFGVLRSAERPSLPFWIFALLGSFFVMGFMLQGDQGHLLGPGDLLMILAIIVCGLSYAEGGRLAKTLGGWQVICWALVISLPLMLLLSFYYLPKQWSTVPISAYAGLLYVSLFSMLIGFFFWYKGLALGGIAKVGQIQLLQPFIGLVFSAIILGESVTLGMIAVSMAVMLCVLMAKRYT
ncbi:EamA-like transporter family protein [Acinetobacter calcoaceticus]|uniref:EamA-like transporter family protein n=1 Tax=Acinetobacter calcoaceticus TaxID=471 RepID=A0A4R1XQ81_ACICA|nr:EamA-like transporter family protein [Acinetobacter calcoaceticus]